MSSILHGNKYSPAGSRVPTDMLPNAIRYETARAAIFEQQGNFVRANDCLRLKALLRTASNGRVLFRPRANLTPRLQATHPDRSHQSDAPIHTL